MHTQTTLMVQSTAAIKKSSSFACCIDRETVLYAVCLPGIHLSSFINSTVFFKKRCMQPQNIKLNTLSRCLFSKTWPYSGMVMYRKQLYMLRLSPCVVIFLKAFKLDCFVFLQMLLQCSMFLFFYKCYFNAVCFLQCKSIKAFRLLQK